MHTFLIVGVTLYGIWWVLSMKFVLGAAVAQIKELRAENEALRAENEDLRECKEILWAEFNMLLEGK